MSSNVYVEDTFRPIVYDKIVYNDYLINTQGYVKNARDDSFRRIYSDSKGRSLVVLYKPKKESVSAYISDILSETFGTNSEFSNIKPAKENKIVDTAPSSNSKRGIVCNETGKQFKSYSAAAKYFGVSYDRFYNSLYDHGVFYHNNEEYTFSKVN